MDYLKIIYISNMDHNIAVNACVITIALQNQNVTNNIDSNFKRFIIKKISKTKSKIIKYKVLFKKGSIKLNTFL